MWQNLWTESCTMIKNWDIVNSSLRWGTVLIYRSIRIKYTVQNILSVIPHFFWLCKKQGLSQWGWSPRKFWDNFWVLVSCKGQKSLFSDLLEIRNNFSKIEWKKGPFFLQFYIQNRQFQGIKKLGDLATPQGFWKHLGVVKTQTKNCEKFVYCTTSHKGVAAL